MERQYFQAVSKVLNVKIYACIIIFKKVNKDILFSHSFSTSKNLIHEIYCMRRIINFIPKNEKLKEAIC